MTNDRTTSSDPAASGDRVDTTRLQHMARAYTESALLWAGLDLGVFTAVAGGARDNDALAAACSISRLNADRLVSCLLGLDLLRLGDHGELVNAPDAEKFLVRGSSRYAGPWMRFTRPDVPGWMNLSELLRSPEPPRPLGMYSDLTVEQARTYHQATASIGMGAGRRFARTVDLTGRRHLLDLGGGSGAYSINAVQAYPNLRATVLDLPPVVEVTAEYLADHDVADRVDTIGGDFTADPFPECDVVVMASNLPIYNEETIAAVVAKVFGALVPGGEMHLVGEMLNDDGVGPLDAALWGMQEILYNSGGKAHTRAQVRGYFEAAGFVDVAEHEFVPGVLVRVTGRKAA
ncbi:MAG: methyltransferase [Acidimicrobiales bacterium]